MRNKAQEIMRQFNYLKNTPTRRMLQRQDAREEARKQKKQKKEIDKMVEKAVNNPYFIAGFRLHKLASLGVIHYATYDEYMDQLSNIWGTAKTVKERDDKLAELLDWAQAIADVYEEIAENEQ